MARYFFHFASKDEFIPDYDGVVLSDLKAAHRHAIRLVSQTMPVLGDDDPRHWKIEITDERQLVLLTVLFPANGPSGGKSLDQREPIKFDCVVVRQRGPGGNADLLLRPPSG